MTDHARELRRHSRKLGSPTGDTPSVMAEAAEHIDAQAAEIERLNQIIINAVHRCCRAAANGPHKMGCDAQRARNGKSND